MVVVALVLGAVRASRALGPLPVGVIATASLAAGVIGVAGAGILAMAGGTAAPVIGGVTAMVTAGARRVCWRKATRWSVGPLGPGMTCSWHL
jgi:hypothetical protein